MRKLSRKREVNHTGKMKTPKANWLKQIGVCKPKQEKWVTAVCVSVIHLLQSTTPQVDESSLEKP